MTKDIPAFKNEMGSLMEVKTASNNYIKGKNTINSRIGEEFEQEKPIINYNKNLPASSNKQEPLQKTQTGTQQMKPSNQGQTASEISDKRLEEIKAEHYSRKKGSHSKIDMQKSLKGD